MCGRYALFSTTEQLAALFALTGVPPALKPRYNIAPTQPIPIVRMAQPGQGGPTGAEEPGRELAIMRWGFVPKWSKDRLGKGLPSMINARAETAAAKPAFREAFRRRRCLVPADGFYEWQKPLQGRKGVKQPMFIRARDGRPFGIAGLWERWEPRHADNEGPLESCVILTTTPNALVEPIHDRMPAIIAPEDFDRWLDPDSTDPDALAAMLTPLAAERMQVIPVSRSVNSPSVDDASCIAPMAAEDRAGEENARGRDRPRTLWE